MSERSGSVTSILLALVRHQCFLFTHEIANQDSSWKRGSSPGRKKPFRLTRKVSGTDFTRKFRLTGERPWSHMFFFPLLKRN